MTDYISRLACECLVVPQQQELESVASEKAAWNTLLNQPRIRRMRKMDGWMVMVHKEVKTRKFNDMDQKVKEHFSSIFT